MSYIPDDPEPLKLLGIKLNSLKIEIDVVAELVKEVALFLTPEDRKAIIRNQKAAIDKSQTDVERHIREKHHLVSKS